MNANTPNFRDLPVSERIQLVEDIWDSIAADTSGTIQLGPGERAELHRRHAEHQANAGSGIPWEKVRAELFKAQR